MITVDCARHVVGGVDTHRDPNVAAVVDMNDGLLGVESFPTTAGGHRLLSPWMAGFGSIERVGIEGTGAYWAGQGVCDCEPQSAGPVPSECATR